MRPPPANASRSGLATTLRRAAFGSIRRILVLLPALVLAPVLVFQGWVFHRWILHEKADEIQRNLELVRDLRTGFEKYLTAVAHEAETVGYVLSTGDRRPERRTEILRAAARYPGLRDLLWAEPSGRVLAAASGDSRGRSLAGDGIVDALRDGRQWALSDLLPYYSTAGHPAVVLARAVRAPKGELVGIVGAVVDPNLLVRFLDLRGGPGSVAALLDRRGRVVCRQPEAEGSAGRPDPFDPSFRELRRGLEAGGTAWIVSAEPEGEPRTFAAVPIPSLGWTAVSTIPLSGATRTAEPEIRRGVIGLGLVAAACAVLALTLGKAVSRPAGRLEEHALAVGRGDLDSRVEEEGPRELKQVAEALNQMAEQLQRREAERTRAESALRVSEETLRLSNRAGAIGTWDLDIPGQRLTWDRMSKDLVGLAPEAEPSYETFLNLMHPDDRDRVQHAVERALETLDEYEVEYRTVLPDGHVRWIEARGRAFTDREGRPVRMVGVAMDVSRRKEYEAALGRAREAEALDRAKSDFMAVASHELHTPLNSVIGYAELLLDEIEGPLNGSQRTSVERIIAAGRRLVSLADAILDLSRMQTVGMPLASQEFHVRPIVEQSISAYEDQAHRKGLHFTSSFAPGLPAALRGDAERLVQALSLLLDNAVKFTEGGGIALEVARHSSLGRRECLRFTVADTGPGIPPEKQALIFKPFEQVEDHATRAHEGLGIGLPICQGLVEKMGGRLWVESHPGQGSAFTFTACFELP